MAHRGGHKKPRAASTRQSDLPDGPVTKYHGTLYLIMFDYIPETTTDAKQGLNVYLALISPRIDSKARPSKLKLEA